MTIDRLSAPLATRIHNIIFESTKQGSMAACLVNSMVALLRYVMLFNIYPILIRVANGRFRVPLTVYISPFIYNYIHFFQEAKTIDPNESFAWKDSTLDRKLKELEERARQQSASRAVDENGFDKNIDKSIGNWSSLPKVVNPDVILLQKARGKNIENNNLTKQI